MSKTVFAPILLSIPFLLLTSGCNRSSGDIWEETKTAGRHLHHKTRALWADDQESRLVRSSDEFVGPGEEEFIPLQADDLQTAGSTEEYAPGQASETRSHEPPASIDLFEEPSDDLARIFRRVHFNTDEHILRKKEYFESVNRIAQYLKEHPQTYVFVIGHCDQRASESYNLALGTRRANAIKNLLVQRGVSPKKVYTISLGKEMPLDARNIRDAWAVNRRVEFKIYSKQ